MLLQCSASEVSFTDLEPGLCYRGVECFAFDEILRWNRELEVLNFPLGGGDMELLFLSSY